MIATFKTTLPKKVIFFTYLLLLCTSAMAQKKALLVFKSDFYTPLDCKDWVVEIDNISGHNLTVYTSKNALVLDTLGGVTVWSDFAASKFAL